MTLHLVTVIYDFFVCQMLCNTHLTILNKIKSNHTNIVKYSGEVGKMWDELFLPSLYLQYLMNNMGFDKQEI